MATHEFKCRQCGDIRVITTPAGQSPQHPYCLTCQRTYVKVFGFSFTGIPIEIHGPGGKFGSERSYKSDRDRRSDEMSNRIGREVTLGSFDARDKDQDPTNPL